MAVDREPGEGQEGRVSEQPPPEEPYELPGTEAAWEPSTLPDRPLTAAAASCFVEKIIS